MWFLLCRHDVRRVQEKFFLADSSKLIAVRLIFGILSPKTSDSCFVDMMYVQLMKNFLLADASGVLAIRLILASWAQKRLILTFHTSCTSSSWKIIFSPIRASWSLLDSFWHPERKNKWFLLCRHDVRRVHEKFSSRRVERGIGY